MGTELAKSAVSIVPSVIFSVVILVVIFYIYGNSLITMLTPEAGAVPNVNVVPDIV